MSGMGSWSDVNKCVKLNDKPYRLVRAKRPKMRHPRSRMQFSCTRTSHHIDRHDQRENVICSPFFFVRGEGWR